MKRIFLATTAFVALTGAVSAADLSVPYKAPPVVAPACAQFGGFYVGANVGGTYHTAHRNDDDGYFVDNAGHTLVGSGWNGGVQGGYNWQRRCTVFGFEADASWGSVKAQFFDNPNVPGNIQTIDTKLKSFGTVRARGGVVVDDVLLYVTAGAAWARTENIYTQNFGAVIETNTFGVNRWGWTAGAGIEWAFAANWTLKTEALYMQFSQQSETFFSPNNGAANFRFTNNDNVLVARIGVNYIFGGAPVVARY